ncbi:MAG: hypothetical protein IPL83_02415 [Bdellovibrionales bacterium]|nr:hypothetical protein [Bdellovibrionales bacterium]
MKSLFLATTAIIVLASTNSFAKKAERTEAERTAMSQCRQANPRPERPERGTRPTEEQRAAGDAHRAAMKTCMANAGFDLPDRPPGHKGRHHDKMQSGEAESDYHGNSDVSQ